MPNTAGAIRLFQAAGITVFLHWSWFLVAVYEVQQKSRYSSISWGILEYMAIFAIVTLHEFGHALACRQVGGRAERIVLWPLGGVAYVDPPPRPGANLWSISAGPLVNVALMPLLGLAWLALRSASSTSDFTRFLVALNQINLVLFLFNVLPVYPLDGGKILRSLLWYLVGRARSLMAAVVVGFIGVAGLGLLAFYSQSGWLGVITLFAALQCYNGFKLAQALKRLEDTPRREGVACPACGARPPIGAFWSCGICKSAFDTFAVNAKCPKCYTTFPKTTCTECGVQSPVSNWFATEIPAPAVETQPLKVKPPLTAPSVIPVVLGIVSALGALIVLLVALLFFKISSDDAALQPQFRGQIEKLWQSDGIPVPGEGTYTLIRRERYDAYFEGSATDMAYKNSIDIQVKDADSGMLVTLRHYAGRGLLQNNDRTLLPMVVFTIPVTGRYTVQASSPTALSPGSRIKIGPEIELVNGLNASIGRGLAIAFSVFAVVLIGLAVLLLVIYFRRRQEFHQVLQKANVVL